MTEIELQQDILTELQLCSDQLVFMQEIICIAVCFLVGWSIWNTWCSSKDHKEFY